MENLGIKTKVENGQYFWGVEHKWEEINKSLYTQIQRHDRRAELAEKNEELAKLKKQIAEVKAKYEEAGK